MLVYQRIYHLVIWQFAMGQIESISIEVDAAGKIIKISIWAIGFHGELLVITRG